MDADKSFSPVRSWLYITTAEYSTWGHLPDIDLIQALSDSAVVRRALEKDLFVRGSFCAGDK